MAAEAGEVTLGKEALDDGRRGALPIDPDRDTGESMEIRGDPRRHRTAQRSILLVIGCAGAVGALARYAVALLLPTPAGHFPWSTFWINITGSLVIGVVLVLLAERFPRARIARPLVVTGFLGAYTTFSTYMVDADLLFRGHDIATGVIYALSSLIAGAAAVFAGIVFARFVIRLDHRLNEQLS
ncbi:MAG: fluoride efflux transporter FluC [Acidimicrobiales bacterium]